MATNGTNISGIICYRLDRDTVECDGIEYGGGELLGPDDVLFWGYILLYIFLVLFAGSEGVPLFSWGGISTQK